MGRAFVSIIAAALIPIGASAQAPGAGARTTAIPDDLAITLERSACFGECPVYTVTIDARGKVTYDGADFVRVTGRQTDQVPVARVAALLDTADRIGFFRLRDQYRVIQNADGRSMVVTDLPTTFVTITRAGRSKRVEDYVGAPEGLKQLEREIDEAAGTRRWILLDAATLAQLVRDGWSPAPEERAELFRRAIEDDEPAVVKGLIDLGADPNGGHLGTNTPPLMLVRSAAVTRLLLDAGANPNTVNDSGGTPLGWSVYLAPEVGLLLIEAGAHVDGPSDPDGLTPLWRAACAGNSGLVGILLGAGADPSARAAGKAAIECAREARAESRGQPPLPADHPAYLPDFDRTIVLLEQALARHSRR
ncbi:MAG: DUF6438 domain-containing protein [Acidobacteriota bacterium]